MPKRCLCTFSAVFACAAWGAFALQTASWAQTCNPNAPPSTPSHQFTVHGNGTVTHNTTGLMWKVCSEGQTWNDGACGSANSATTYTFDSALSSAQTHDYAGHSDWRMPSVQELRSILETCRRSPIANMINDEIFPATPSKFMLTGSPEINDPNLAWGVSFSNGLGLIADRNNGDPVRFVRVGQALGHRAFLTNGYCGQAAHEPRVAAPATGLCGDATAPAVAAMAHAYLWRCVGAINTSTDQTGATVACSTPRQHFVAVQNFANSNGALACEPTRGGLPEAVTRVIYNETATCEATPNAGYRTASISGCGAATGSGVNRFVSGPVTTVCFVSATFEIAPPSGENGICGSAQNAFSATAPTANLCVSGAGNSVVAQVGNNWNWTCRPVNGGVAADCSSPATTCTMDVDGDGLVNTQIDALIHARVAAGMTGPDVLNGFTIPLHAARRDWTSIRNHLVNRCGMSLP